MSSKQVSNSWFLLLLVWKEGRGRPNPSLKYMAREDGSNLIYGWSRLSRCKALRNFPQYLGRRTIQNKPQILHWLQTNELCKNPKINLDFKNSQNQKCTSLKGYKSNPIRSLTILEAQDQEVGEFYSVQGCRTTVSEASKFWKGRSGSFPWIPSLDFEKTPLKKKCIY